MIGCAQLSPRLGKLGRVDKHGDVQPDDMDLDARFASLRQRRSRRFPSSPGKVSGDPAAANERVRPDQRSTASASARSGGAAPLEQPVAIAFGTDLRDPFLGAPPS